MPLLAVVLLCAAAYAGARTLRAWILMPLTDEVILPSLQGGKQEALSALPFELPASLSSALGSAGADAETSSREVVPAPETAGEAPASEAELRRRLAVRMEGGWTKILLAGLALVLVLPLAHFGQLYLTQYTMGRVLVDVQQQLAAKLLSLPLGFHKSAARGDTLSRTTNDATRAHFALDLLFGDVVQSGLALAVGAAMLLAISWQLTLGLAVVGPLVAGVIAFFGRRIRRASRRRQESLGDVTQRLLQILSGIKVIKGFRAESLEEEAFREDNLRYFRRNMKVAKNRALSRTFVEALNNTVAVVVIVVGVVLVVFGLGGLTLGSLLAFAAVMQTTYRPLKELTKGWTNLQDSMPGAERFFELLDTPGEPADAVDAVPFAGVREGIRFRNVSFSYGREPVLRDVCMEARAGETVAVVGRTGAGKTTLVDLLVRFYDVDEGSIEIDGVDVRRLGRASLLDRVAIVTQEPFLFDASIRENIRYGAPRASDADVEAAAVAAHVKEFVDTLPDGMDTAVGEGGGMLSGGQRQRVTLARALLRNPDLLILDEATSALDARSERYVQEALERLMEGRTAFVIAHRLSTIRDADRIVVLEGGRVAACGTHDELLERSPLYRELVALQTA